ncbi:MAG: hypothetical protein NTY90_01075 [Candidatus Micrarchaeota archaeon]|nr:hypothetical protein [Candidatus Micrarchaeota archaeon]
MAETTIQMSSVMADMKRPFLKVTNRWEYLDRYLPWWKGYIRYRLYAIVFAAIGVGTIFSVPPLGVLCLAASTYYYQIHIHRKERIESKRTVIIGH